MASVQFKCWSMAVDWTTFVHFPSPSTASFSIWAHCTNRVQTMQMPRRS